MGPIGWAIIGITALYEIFALNVGGAKDALYNFTAEIEKLFPFLKGLTEMLGGLFGDFQDETADTGYRINELTGNVEQFDRSAEGMNEEMNKMNELFATSNPDGLAGGIDGLAGSFDGLHESMAGPKDEPEWFKLMFGQTGEFDRQIEDYERRIETLALSIGEGIITIGKEHTVAMQGMHDESVEMLHVYEKLWGREAAIEHVRNIALLNPAIADVLNQSIETFKGTTEVINEATSAMNEFSHAVDDGKKNYENLATAIRPSGYGGSGGSGGSSRGRQLKPGFGITEELSAAWEKYNADRYRQGINDIDGYLTAIGKQNAKDLRDYERAKLTEYNEGRSSTMSTVSHGPRNLSFTANGVTYYSRGGPPRPLKKSERYRPPIVREENLIDNWKSSLDSKGRFDHLPDHLKQLGLSYVANSTREDYTRWKWEWERMPPRHSGRRNHIFSANPIFARYTGQVLPLLDQLANLETITGVTIPITKRSGLRGSSGLSQFREMINHLNEFENINAANVDLGRRASGGTLDEFRTFFANLRTERERIQGRHGFSFAEQIRQEKQYGEGEFERRISVLERQADHRARRRSEIPQGDDLLTMLNRENRMLLEAVQT